MPGRHDPPALADALVVADVVGVDLGGTKIEACVLDARDLEPGDLDPGAARVGGNLEAAPRVRLRVPTQREDGYDAIVERTAGLVRRVCAEASVPLARVRVGVGMPGSVTRAGLVKGSNTTCLNGRPFRQDLVARLGLPPERVVFDNDANLFALAEARGGAARGVPGLIFGAILGTGVGGGLVFDGRVWGGRGGGAGEWGHHAVWAASPAARACYCGGKGCVEAHLAGPSLEAHYRELTGRSLSLAAIVAQRGEDPAAEAVVEGMLSTFARGLANVIDVIDPAAIVLGGGLSQLDCLYDEGVARLRGLVFTDTFDTPVLRPALGDSAGVFGAAYLASQAPR